MSGLQGFLVRLGFGLAVFFLVLWFVDFREAIEVLRGVDLRLVVPALVCLLGTRFLVGLKWWVLLGARQSLIGYPAVQRAILIADYQALLFPNTLAVDALRLVLLRHHPRGLTYMTSTIIADRIINVVVTATVGCLAMLVLLQMPAGTAIAPAVAHTVLGLAVLVIAAGFAVQSERLFALAMLVLQHIVARGPLRRPALRIIDKANELHRATRVVLAEPRTFAAAVFLSLLVTVCRIGFVYFLLLAAGAAISLALVTAVYPIITLLVLLPITIVGLGVQDGAFVFFFGGVGVPAGTALATSITIYAAILGTALVVGFLATIFGPALPRAEPNTQDQGS